MENVKATRNDDRIIWFLLLFLLFVPSLIWIWLDQSVHPWDPSWYGELSVDLYQTLHSSVSSWSHKLWIAITDRAPGLIWLGEFFIPVGLQFGRADFGLLVCAWCLQFGSVCLVFAVAMQLFDDHLAALVSAVFLSSGPLFVGLSRSYFTEPFQGLGVALFMFVLSRADGRPVVRTALLLTLSALIALFGKIATPVYLISPGGLFIWFLVRNWRELHNFRPGWIEIVLAALTLAIAAAFVWWFARNYAAVIAHATLASGAEYYGSRSGLLHKIPLWTRQLLMSFLHPEVRYFVGAGVLLATWSRIKAWAGRTWSDLVALACAAEIVVALALFSLNVTEDPRFCFPLFPYFAILLAWMVAWLPRVGRWAACAAAMTQFLLILGYSFGLLAPAPILSPYLIPLDSKGEHLAQLRQVLRLTCNSETNSRWIFLGLSLPYFNANSLSYYSKSESIQAGPKCGYLSLAGSDLENVWRNVLAAQPVAIVFLKNELSRVPPNDALNPYSTAVFNRASSVSEFVLNRPVENPNLIIFRAASPELKAVPRELNTRPTVTVGQAAIDLVDDVTGAKTGYVFHVNANSPLSIRGWAYDDLHKTAPATLWVQLESKQSGQRFFVPADRTDRPDVAAAFGSPWAKRCGFATPVISNHNIPHGTYDLKIYQVQSGIAELTTYYPAPSVTVIFE